MNRTQGGKRERRRRRGEEGKRSNKGSKETRIEEKQRDILPTNEIPEFSSPEG
jgi:hypothetical protein